MAIDRTYIPYEGDYSAYGFGPEHLFFEYGGGLGLGDSALRDEAEARGTTVEQILNEGTDAAKAAEARLRELYFPGGEESENLTLGGDVAGTRAGALQDLQVTDVQQGGPGLGQHVVSRKEWQERTPAGMFLGGMIGRAFPGAGYAAGWSEDKWNELASNPENKEITITNRMGQQGKAIIGPNGEIVASQPGDIPADQFGQYLREHAKEIAEAPPGQAPAAPGAVEPPSLETATAPDRTVGAFGPATPAGGELGGGYGVGAGYGGYVGPGTEPSPYAGPPAGPTAQPSPYAPPADLPGHLQAPAPGSPADIAGRTPSTGRAAALEDLLGQASDYAYGRTAPGNYDEARRDLQAIVDKARKGGAGKLERAGGITGLIDLYKGEQARTAPQFAGRGEHAGLPERTPVISGVREGVKDLAELGRQAKEIIDRHGGYFGPGGQAAVDIGKNLAREHGISIPDEPPEPAPSIVDYMPASPLTTAAALPAPAPVPTAPSVPAPAPSPLPAPVPGPKKAGLLENTIKGWLGYGEQPSTAAPAAEQSHLGVGSGMSPAALAEAMGTADVSGFVTEDPGLSFSFVEEPGQEDILSALEEEQIHGALGAWGGAQTGAPVGGYSFGEVGGIPGVGGWGYGALSPTMERYGPLLERRTPSQIQGSVSQGQVGGGIGTDYLDSNIAAYLDAARNDPTGFETATPADLVANYNEQQPNFGGLHEQDRRAEYGVPFGASETPAQRADREFQEATRAGPGGRPTVSLIVEGAKQPGSVGTGSKAAQDQPTGGGDGGAAGGTTGGTPAGAPGPAGPHGTGFGVGSAFGGAPGFSGPATHNPATGVDPQSADPGTAGEGGSFGGFGGGYGGGATSDVEASDPGTSDPGVDAAESGNQWHTGGYVEGPDPTRRGEETPANLLEGEFVLTPELVDIIGLENLRRLQATANRI